MVNIHITDCMQTISARLPIYLVDGFNANKGLSEGNGSETAVKEKQADVRVDVQEGGHIQIVGQGGR